MTIKQIQKLEKVANESIKYARQAMKKSDELQSLLSLVEYKQGRKNHHSSVDQLFKKLKIS